jgi:hypothetical protein
MFLIYEDNQEPADHAKLDALHQNFSHIDINDKNLDLDKSIEAIKEARELYPLDNTLKTIDIELEHKKANHSE